MNGNVLQCNQLTCDEINEETKLYIRNLLFDGNFDKAIKELNLFYNHMKKSKEKNSKTYLWFVYYNKSYIYLKTGNNRLALSFAKKASSCAELAIEKINTMWMIMITKENILGKNDELIKKNKRICLKCATEYKNTGEIKLRISILYHRTRIGKDTKKMFRLLTILEKVEDTEDTYINQAKDMRKEHMIKDRLVELIDLCIEKKDIEMINKVKQHFKNKPYYLKIILNELKKSLLIK